MAAISKEQILDALTQVKDIGGARDVVSAGRISGVVIQGSNIGFMLSIDASEHAQMEVVRQQCESAVKQLSGVEKVTAVMTADAHKAAPAPEAKAAATAPKVAATWNTEKLPHVKRIIAVASGKGGVGKSTTTVNLARALTQKGLRVGVLDADIQGASTAQMLNLNTPPVIEENRFIPCVNEEGIACLSMALITGDNKAVIWRGPQVTKALQQMLRQTQWGTEAEPLDALLIDMPPGTGDIHLSLVQQVPVDGAIIITTPQEISTLDAGKAIEMFMKVNVPILGVVENMSWFEAPDGSRYALFGEGGGQKMADEFKVEMLTQLPLVPALREAADKGVAPDVSLYSALAERIIQSA